MLVKYSSEVNIKYQYSEKITYAGKAHDLNARDQALLLFIVASVVLEFERRASHLQSRCSTAGPHLQLIVLWSRPAWTMILLFYVSYLLEDDRCIPPCPAFLAEMQSHKLLCPGWSGTVIHLISESQVCRILGMNHQCPAKRLVLAIMKQPRIVKTYKNIN
jgi:hypothetical protein